MKNKSNGNIFIKFFKNIIKFFKKIILKIKGFSFLDEQSIINYIFTTETLPAPLSTDDEQNYVIAFQENHDKTAKSKLIEHNLRLVMYIAKKFESPKLDLEELVSVGSIGLIKAVDSYKLDKNIKLATYASRCIENEILMYLRKANKSINDLSLDDSLVHDDEGNSLTLGEIIPDNNLVTDQVEFKDEKQILLNAIKGLNEREYKIMCMRYGLNGNDELTQKEVADTMNISQSYISRLEKKIIKKLKHELNKTL